VVPGPFGQLGGGRPAAGGGQRLADGEGGPAQEDGEQGQDDPDRAEPEEPADPASPLAGTLGATGASGVTGPSGAFEVFRCLGLGKGRPGSPVGDAGGTVGGPGRVRGRAALVPRRPVPV